MLGRQKKMDLIYGVYKRRRKSTIKRQGEAAIVYERNWIKLMQEQARISQGDRELIGFVDVNERSRPPEQNVYTMEWKGGFGEICYISAPIITKQQTTQA